MWTKCVAAVLFRNPEDIISSIIPPSGKSSLNCINTVAPYVPFYTHLMLAEVLDINTSLGDWETALWSHQHFPLSVRKTLHLNWWRWHGQTVEGESVWHVVGLQTCRTSCGSWILEHFDNTGKKRCSGRGRGSGERRDVCPSPGGSNGLQRVRKTPFSLSSSPIMDTKQISFKERPDRVPFDLIIWIQGKVTLFSLLWWVFFVQIVVDPHAPLRRFVLTSVQCAFLLFILLF